MEILTYGMGERLRVCSSAVAADYVGDCRIIILPIPTSRDGVHVSGTEVELSEVCREVREGTLVAGYGIPEGVAREILELGGSIYDGSLDEVLISENATLTALGALGYILTELPASPSELSFGIVGYGRIGSRLLRLLLFLGARVRVYSGNSATLRELSELGIEAVDYRGSSDFSGLDVLINTAPARIVTKKAIRECCGLRVIDLASGRYLEGISGLVKLPSIPEKYYPQSAGRLYARRIAEHLKDKLSRASDKGRG
ncbi:MAG: hypothetical protein IJE25_01465 [Clostridia bacterium]|nr:hypothetical protein [Clostridia bacterium]